LFVADVLAKSIATIPMIKITLPLPENDKTPKNYYIEELLTSIFARENLKVELQYTKTRMNQLRMTKSLINGEFIDLTWLPFTRERSKKLLAIKIPLYKGIHGTRLLIINKKDLEKFEGISTLKQLSQLVGVQHHSWSDYDLLVNNNLRMKGDLRYSGMLKAVSSGLIDYFPRSALTIRDELKNNKDLQLIIEPTLVLKYPSYINFFVSKKTPELAKIIRSGMNKMVADGSFERMFNKYNGRNLLELNLSNRKIIMLKNDTINLQVNN
jgi:hypothetical protein